MSDEQIFHGIDKVICRDFSKSSIFKSIAPSPATARKWRVLKCWLWRYEDEVRRHHDEQKLDVLQLGVKLHPDKYFPSFVSQPKMVNVDYKRAFPSSPIPLPKTEEVRVNVSGFIKGAQLTCVVKPTVKEHVLQFYSIDCFVEDFFEVEPEFDSLQKSPTIPFTITERVEKRYISPEEKRKRKALARRKQRKKSKKRKRR